MRYIINNQIGHFVAYPNSGGHGSMGQIKSASWLGKSIRFETEGDIRLNKRSLTSCLIHQHGCTELKKGWFFGLIGASSDKDVKEAALKVLASMQNSSQQESEILSRRESKVTMESESDTEVEPIDPKIGREELFLGNIYLNEGKLDEAFQSLKKSADMGNVEAQRRVGLMYLEGKGVLQSDDEALNYLKRAADRKDPEAISKLAELKQ